MQSCRYDQYADAWDTSVTRNIDGQEVRYFHTKKNGVDRVWIDNEAFLAKVPSSFIELVSTYSLVDILY